MRRKVFKGQLFKKGEHEPRDAYIAADNQQQVADIANCSLYTIQKYWMNTGFNALHHLSSEAFTHPLTIIWGEAPQHHGTRPPIGKEAENVKNA